MMLVLEGALTWALTVVAVIWALQVALIAILCGGLAVRGSMRNWKMSMGSYNAGELRAVRAR